VALSKQQRFQTVRLPVPNGVIDESGDRWAIAGVIQSFNLCFSDSVGFTETATLSIIGASTLAFSQSAIAEISGMAEQRFQTVRLGIANSDIDEIGDRYAMAGVIRPLQPEGTVTERFDAIWFIDPIWTEIELPQTGDGATEVAVSGFSMSFQGIGQPTATDPIRFIQFSGESTGMTISEQTTSISFASEDDSMSIVKASLDF